MCPSDEKFTNSSGHFTMKSNVRLNYGKRTDIKGIAFLKELVKGCQLASRLYWTKLGSNWVLLFETVDLQKSSSLVD